MTTRLRTLVFVAALVAILTPAAFAQNDSFDTSVFLTPGQPAVMLRLDAVNTQRWYATWVQPSRSYCAEVTTSWASEFTRGNPAVTVFASDGSTQIIHNADMLNEPAGPFQARACWTESLTEPTIARYIRVIQVGATTQNYVLRVVETTLWSSWYFVGGDYNSFLLMRNTTNLPVHFVATWRNAAGTVVGTSGSVTVSAHGGVGINAKTYITDPVTNYNGTIEIAHDGSPDALVGQMTSLSSSTGLGFDAPLFQRKPW